MGWKVLDIGAEGRRREARSGAEEGAPEQVLPATLAKGQFQNVTNIELLRKKTRPPKRFTEGTLLTAMQTAGQTLDERELSEAMKEIGLGTPATRAATIEVLLKRGFIARAGKNLEATDKGIHLIDVVHPEVKSPVMTGQWEAFLKKIQQGESRLEPFLGGIIEYVRSVVSKVGQTTPLVPRAKVADSSKDSESRVLIDAKKFSTFATLAELLQNAFGFSASTLRIWPNPGGAAPKFETYSAPSGPMVIAVGTMSPVRMSSVWPEGLTRTILPLPGFGKPAAADNSST
jgi:DNA topoisomerase-3